MKSVESSEKTIEILQSSLIQKDEQLKLFQDEIGKLIYQRDELLSKLSLDIRAL
jgi:hypothetical protein